MNIAVGIRSISSDRRDRCMERGPSLWSWVGQAGVGGAWSGRWLSGYVAAELGEGFSQEVVAVGAGEGSQVWPSHRCLPSSAAAARWGSGGTSAVNPGSGKNG